MEVKDWSNNVSIVRKDYDAPIYSRFDGTCKICGKPYYKGEQISPYFEYDFKLWRHTDCYQIFYISFKYSSDCIGCHKKIGSSGYGYWSKHNGTWCVECGEELFPNRRVAYSRYQHEFFSKYREDEV